MCILNYCLDNSLFIDCEDPSCCGGIEDLPMSEHDTGNNNIHCSEFSLSSSNIILSQTDLLKVFFFGN